MEPMSNITDEAQNGDMSTTDTLAAMRDEIGTVKKRKGRWGTTHYFIDGIASLKGDYQRTGNAFDTAPQARKYAEVHGIALEARNGE